MNNEKNLQPVNLQLVAAKYEEEEISLYDLFCILANYKYFIASVTALCTIVAIIYATWLSPVYQAEAYILPPNESDIVDLNVNASNYSVNQAYHEYIKTFKSRAVRRQFFKQNNLLEKLTGDDTSEIDINYLFDNKFNQKLIMEKPKDKSNKDAMLVKFTASEAEITAEWLNKYLDYANQKSVESLKLNISSKINTGKDKLKIEIANLREKAVKEKGDKIKAIMEAIQIAENLDMKENSPSNISDADLGNHQSTNVMLNADIQPLYTRGKDALSEELRILKLRQDDTPFIEGLRQLEAEIQMLDAYSEQLKNNLNISAVIIDQQASIPRYQIKPNKRFIILTGLLLGLSFGVFIVFVISYIDRMKQKK